MKQNPNELHVAMENKSIKEGGFSTGEKCNFVTSIPTLDVPLVYTYLRKVYVTVHVDSYINY